MGSHQSFLHTQDCHQLSMCPTPNPADDSAGHTPVLEREEGWTKQLQCHPSLLPLISEKCLSLNFVSHLLCKQGTACLHYQPALHTSCSGMAAFAWTTAALSPAVPCCLCRLLMCFSVPDPDSAACDPAVLPLCLLSNVVHCSALFTDTFSCGYTKPHLAILNGILSQFMVIFRKRSQTLALL